MAADLSERGRWRSWAKWAVAAAGLAVVFGFGSTMWSTIGKTTSYPDGRLALVRAIDATVEEAYQFTYRADSVHRTAAPEPIDDGPPVIGRFLGRSGRVWTDELVTQTEVSGQVAGRRSSSIRETWTQGEAGPDQLQQEHAVRIVDGRIFVSGDEATWWEVRSKDEVGVGYPWAPGQLFDGVREALGTGQVEDRGVTRHEGQAVRELRMVMEDAFESPDGKPISVTEGTAKFFVDPESGLIRSVTFEVATEVVIDDPDQGMRSIEMTVNEAAMSISYDGLIDVEVPNQIAPDDGELIDLVDLRLSIYFEHFADSR